MDCSTDKNKQIPTLEQMLFLSQIVSAQLCHDMASPIGAIFAGIEMLPPVTLPEDQEIIDLLQSASCILKNRLDMFRATFASGGHTLGPKQARALICDYFAFHRNINLNLDWPLDLPSLPKGSFQLLLNILMWLAPKVPKGGEMRIAISPDSFRIEIHLISSLIFFHPEDEALLKGKIMIKNLQPQVVQAYLIYLLSTVLNHSLEIQKFSSQEVLFYLHLSNAPSFGESFIS